MKRICIHCQTEMIKDCKVTVEGDIAGLKISQKRKGLFNNVSAKTKASVCPNCGYVALYIDDFKEFNQ
ncbi:MULTISPECIES: nucleic acid-binding protein [unclassified Fredinandcohnia]|uniref:nucleic acid-binding protein n=1 Tax=unclassified Fredinandcohnia TaxID=2837514 RepID=UPI0030FDB55F